MGEVTYTISQAAKMLGVESHVLRFWEEELELDIGRNAKGYRVYTKENIETMQKIKELKKTHALKDIRDILGGKDQRNQQFFEIMERIIQKTIEERNNPERHCRNIDKAIRNHQQVRKLVAATQENQKGRTDRKEKSGRQKNKGKR